MELIFLLAGTIAVFGAVTIAIGFFLDVVLDIEFGKVMGCVGFACLMLAAAGLACAELIQAWVKYLTA